jgi:hypothetical protein
MKERRKRFSRPLSIICVGILLCLLPAVNYFLILKELAISKYSSLIIFTLLTPLQIILLVSPLPIGLGLLFIKKWAWWAILLYFPTLILYDVSLLISSNSLFNIGVLVRTIFGFTLIFFFLRKDISAPYFKLYPRGWRGENRKPIEIEVTIDGKGYQTLDVSNTGIYVDWKNCEKELGDEVLIIFKPDSDLNSSVSKESKAGVVRIDEFGVGLAFRK